MDAPQEGGQDAGNNAEDAAGESDAPKAITYALSFVRDDSPDLSGFVAELSAEYADGSPASPSGVDITCDRGAPSTEVGAQEGRFTRAFGPDATGTGAYAVTATVDGHFGNPGGFQDANGRVQVWYDDESVSEEQRDLGAIVFEPGEFPAGTSTAPQPLPLPSAVPGVAEIQPFFDGTEALFRQGWDIAYSTYAGGDIFDQASWSPAEYIVESDTTALATQKAGAIVTTGEPTKAVVGGETEVYFVYGVVLADGSVDLNVGVITER